MHIPVLSCFQALHVQVAVRALVCSNRDAGVVFAEVCKRLIVLKNGVRDVSKAVAVVGPDLTNVSTKQS